MAAKKAPHSSKARSFVISRDGMDKINAVEGITRSAESRRMFSEFDRQRLPFEQRRRALIAAHAKKV